MEITVLQDGNVTIVSAVGSLDALTAEAFSAALIQEVGQGNPRLVANLAGVDYASSAGLRAILTALKDARSNDGDLRLAEVTPTVNKVLELSGFTSILKVFPDVAAAVASFA